MFESWKAFAFCNVNILSRLHSVSPGIGFPGVLKGQYVVHTIKIIHLLPVWLSAALLVGYQSAKLQTEPQAMKRILEDNEVSTTPSIR